jgi:hypothetical protein
LGYFSSSTISTVNRRPVPLPPAPPAYPALRQVKAKFDFEAEDAGELSFKMGDLLDVIKEDEGDGW